MLRAFLIVWTVVAGLAAAGLLYIVGWRPQTTVVAERLTSPGGATASAPAVATPPATLPSSGTPAPATVSTAATGRAATAPTATGQTNTASAAPPAASAAASAPATSPDSPAATGSVTPAAPARSATRSVRRIDEPRAPQTAASSTPEPPNVAPAQNAGPVTAERKADPPGAAGAEPAQPASPALARGNSRTQAVENRAEESDRPTAQTPVADAPEPPRRPAANVTTAAPMSPPLFSESETKPAPKRAVAARSTRDPAPDLEGDEAASERTPPSASNRTLAQRRRAARAQAAERETSPAPAQIERPSRPRVANTRNARRQARMAQRTRVARGGRSEGLEQLLDDFSRSGADFMHERTIRVGSRYVVERTTRHGTQYYYEVR